MKDKIMKQPQFISTTPAPPGAGPNKGTARRQGRINPWRMFHGSMVPNWLQCRQEISQGAKLAYARLAQHAGKKGECFPKQKTLAVELGVSERMARDYIRTLENFELIESVQKGLRLSNSYYFLDHPWIHEGNLELLATAGSERQPISAPDRNPIAGQERQRTSAPINKEIHIEKNQEKRITPYSPPFNRARANTIRMYCGPWICQP